VVPYPEDDTPKLIEELGGTECLVMGSDWPHAEGLREPGEFYHRLSSLDDKTRRDFLRENGLKLFEGID